MSNTQAENHARPAAAKLNITIDSTAFDEQHGRGAALTFLQRLLDTCLDYPTIALTINDKPAEGGRA